MQRMIDPLPLAMLDVVINRALMAVSQQLLVEDGLEQGNAENTTETAICQNLNLA